MTQPMRGDAGIKAAFHRLHTGSDRKTNIEKKAGKVLGFAGGQREVVVFLCYDRKE